MQLPKFVIVLVLSVILVSSVHCDESSDKEGGLWARLKSMVREFVDSMRNIWDDMKKEIKSRTTDMTSWSQEIFDSFKSKMKEWVDEVGSAASQTEKEDMRNYIERLEMPADNRDS